MKHIRAVLFIIGLLLIGAALFIIIKQTIMRGNTTVGNTNPDQPIMHLTSAAFDDGSRIPDTYTCKGADISPPLSVQNIPNGTKSLALIVHDPDAPGGDFVHWVVWSIPADSSTISEGALPPGAQQGINSFGKRAYNGPCPPAGKAHHYVFDVYAVSTELNLPDSTTRDKLMNAIEGSKIGHATLTGTYSVQ